MKGTIRVFLGLLILVGVAGGIDTATDGELVTLIAISLVGFALMLTGVNAMKHD